MPDRGYWARLGHQPLRREHPTDHPLGFKDGGLNGAVLQRLAVLRKRLTNAAQRQAFDAVIGELQLYGRQTHDAFEGIRTVARNFKALEDDVRRGDLREVRERVRLTPSFDEDAYKRSTLASIDLHAFIDRGEFDASEWERQAALGRELERRLAEQQVKATQQAAEQRQATLIEQHTGPLYKTSPTAVDLVKPRNERKDVAAAERRLVELGFQICVDGVVRSYVRSFGADLVVYADPRRGDSLHFHVFERTRRVESFWVKDTARDPRSKLESRLEELTLKRVGVSLGKRAK